MTYRTDRVDVRGGVLRLGIWESANLDVSSPARRTVLLVHGVTASHLAWALVADHLTAAAGVRVVAPDLRGRGRSAGLPGPWGMATHADDLHLVADRFGPFDVAAGHSMGGFVVVAHAAAHPADVRQLVLVDGGVPLPRPVGLTGAEALQAVLGPAAQRLSMTFADRDAYRDFWRVHPAFADAWTPEIEAYVDYDFVDAGDGSGHSAAVFDAVAQDSAELGTGGIVEHAWARLTRMPPLIRSPLGLQAQPPGLYPVVELERFAATHPGFGWIDAPGTNHYTLVMDEPGAELVAATIEAELPDAGY